MLEFLKNKKILVVVAHPDDEVLGIGGSISLLVKKGAYIKVVILGEGITSRALNRDINKDKNILLKHKKNINDAKKKLGYHDLSVYDLPDNRFDTVPLLDIIKIIEKEKEIFQPDIIFTHNNGDLNIDHQKTFEAVYTAVRPLENEVVKMLICFETMSGTEWTSPSEPKKFTPNLFIELSEEEVLIKTNAMNCYEFEKRGFPHPRSSKAIKNRAITWGVSIGREYAEPFQIIRIIS